MAWKNSNKPRKVEDVNKMYDVCLNMARMLTTGCRNVPERAVGVALKMAEGEELEINDATVKKVIRVVGHEFGTKKWSDRRDILEVVDVERTTKRMIYGTCGEAVRKDTVLFWEG